MTQDDKLQLISDNIGNIQSTLAVLVKQFEIVEERGCKASMNKISEIEDKRIKPIETNLEKNFREHTFIKGIAYTFGGVGALIGYIIHYFKKG